MARQIIDTTTNNGSYIGDPAKTAFEKTNANFLELYNTTEDITLLTSNLTPFSGGYSAPTFGVTGPGGSFTIDDRAEGSVARWVIFASSRTMNFFYPALGMIAMSISNLGAVTAVSFNPTSTSDVKDYIEGYGGNASELLNKLVVISYKYRPEYLDSDETVVGLLQENVKSVIPSAAKDSEIRLEEVDGEMVEKLIPGNYDLAQLMAINTKAHQEKDREIKLLKANIASAISRLDAAGI